MKRKKRNKRDINILLSIQKLIDLNTKIIRNKRIYSRKRKHFKKLEYTDF